MTRPASLNGIGATLHSKFEALRQYDSFSRSEKVAMMIASVIGLSLVAVAAYLFYTGWTSPISDVRGRALGLSPLLFPLWIIGASSGFGLFTAATAPTTIENKEEPQAQEVEYQPKES